MNYSAVFESIGLSSKTPENYQNAEQYAKSFKRCSILTYNNVSYSNNTKQITDKIVNYKDKDLYNLR